ncbi:class F sortase [Streptomyces sp. NBC_01264]|uniref:class F sortase n=1 Tax=Streptomyces sp. NBC_01264 TaxID=2903804 RepID=UPI00224E4831|nr:class F sortase [Streptomyces sp. NBC_01264]MCX4780528.1 class F sortase [Streptomyces sp. NBC_01264]
MPRPQERTKPRGGWGVVAVVALSGTFLLTNGLDLNGGPPQPAQAASLVSDPAHDEAARRLPPAPQPLKYSPPTRIRIPAVQVDAPVTRVGLDAEGWVDAPPPQDRNLAGWYGGSPAPGTRGTAVIDGHVDNEQGPAVFYTLGSLERGRHIEVDRQDGRTAVFTVYGIEVVGKNDFPATRIYGPKGAPELRVITCGGGFSKRDGYDGNVVVFARLTEIRG